MAIELNSQKGVECYFNKGSLRYISDDGPLTDKNKLTGAVKKIALQSNIIMQENQRCETCGSKIDYLQGNDNSGKPVFSEIYNTIIKVFADNALTIKPK